VVATAADTRALEAAVGFRPRTPLDEGIRRYVAWHRAYYGETGLGGALQS
jgi:UDP-glucuronate 4-epimerase